MKSSFQRTVATLGTESSPSLERGFSALEVLVIAVIVCVVVAIGVPTLYARAKVSILESNLQTLASSVMEQAAEGYSSDYRASGEGDPGRCLSTHLEESLVAAGKASYVNPFVGSKEGRAVLNSRSVPTGPQSVPPAVFITDAHQCQYLWFNDLPETSRFLLAGSLIVAFNTDARTVDVFFVNSSGQKSTNVVSVPTR